MEADVVPQFVLLSGKLYRSRVPNVPGILNRVSWVWFGGGPAREVLRPGKGGSLQEVIGQKAWRSLFQEGKLPIATAGAVTPFVGHVPRRGPDLAEACPGSASLSAELLQCFGGRS